MKNCKCGHLMKVIAFFAGAATLIALITTIVVKLTGRCRDNRDEEFYDLDFDEDDEDGECECGECGYANDKDFEKE